ncbi:hypothetical protein [Bradyrhizobium sp. USDA 3364]
MAKGKNEILLSIALEGDQDIKSKLQAVGDIGKQSLTGIEKKIADTGKAFDKVVPESGGGLQKALAPVLETSGIQGALSGVTGLLSRFGGVIAGGGLPAALAAIGAHLAKIREETDGTATRLKALGASESALGNLRQSARTIDAEPKDLTAGFEDFLPVKRRQELQSPFGVSDISEDKFLAAQRALTAGGKIDRLQTPDAVARANSFLRGILQPHDIGNGEQAPGLVAGGLSGLSPSQANRVARAIGGQLGTPIRNADELQLLLEQKDKQGRSPVVRPSTVFDALRQDEPAARAEAEKHRTIGDANDRLKGRFNELGQSFGDILGEPAGKAATGVPDAISEGLRHIRERVDANKPTAEAFGESGRDLGDRTGIPGAGRAGELLGRTEGLAFGLGRDAVRGYGAIGNSIGETLGNTTIGGFLGRALVDPGALQEKQRPGAVQPDQQQPPQPAAQPQAQQPATLGPRSEAQPQQPPQQVADLGGAFLRTLLESVSAAANNASKPDLKVDEPASGGIRGDAGDIGNSVGSIREGVAAIAAALSEAAAEIRSSAKGEPVQVQAAAWGGLIRRRLDGGGHVSGPGTSTSDSIPAMLSDGEYVIRASAARKIGRGGLDWLNAGMPGYADGGDVDSSVVGDTLANSNTLGPGDHQITFDPATGGAWIDGILHTPGDPILEDSLVKQAIAQSKAGMNAQSSKRKIQIRLRRSIWAQRRQRHLCRERRPDRALC